jgi:5-(carboxyamino)imidazole ribonucleotide synthase
MRIGILGDGQLARMLADEALKLNHQLIFFGKETDGPCSGLGHFVKGDHHSLENINEFVDMCDVITMENEFYANEVLEQIEQSKPLYPSASSFKKIGDKKSERELAKEYGLSIIPTQYNLDHYQAVTDELGESFLIKAIKGGYDGYGNCVVSSESEFNKVKADFGASNILAEPLLDLKKEFAITFTRGINGEFVDYPFVETVQKDHKCDYVLFNKNIKVSKADSIIEKCKNLLDGIDYVGVISFEFFELSDGKIVFNEMAPRPHNSAHYTMDACETSQFKNHILAITSNKLENTKFINDYAVMINVLGTHNGKSNFELEERFVDNPEIFIHLYNKKDSRIGRKMGHINLVGTELNKLIDLGQELKQGYRI